MLAKLNRALDIALPYLCYGLLVLSLILLAAGVVSLVVR